MKKMTCAVLAILLCTGFMLTADEKKAEQKPTVKEVEGFFYGHQQFTGPYTTMQEKIQGFIQTFMGQGQMPMGLAISTYYNSAEEVKPEALKWGFGFVVTAETKLKEPLKVTEFKKHKAVVYLHVGPYEKLGDAHNLVSKFIKEKGFDVVWPVYDRYLNNPQMVKPEDLKTEIVIPIK